MPSLLSAFGGLISGAGQGMADVAKEGLKSDAELAKVDRAADRSLDNSIRLKMVEEDLKNSAGNAYSKAYSDAKSSQVPVTPDAVGKLTGNYEGKLDRGSNSGGIKGRTPEELQAWLSQIPDDNPDKAGIIAQLQKQVAADAQTKKDEVAGKTRTPTDKEAHDLAMENLRGTNAAGYMAGKAMEGEKYQIVPDGGTVLDRSGKVIYSSPGKDERSQRWEKVKEDDRISRETIAATNAAAKEAATNKNNGFTALLNASQAEMKRLSEENKQHVSIMGLVGNPNKPDYKEADSARKKNNARIQELASDLSIIVGEIDPRLAKKPKPATTQAGSNPKDPLDLLEK